MFSCLVVSEHLIDVMLLQTVKGVAESAPLWDADWGERLLIHISYSPRRYSSWNLCVVIMSSNVFVSLT